MNLGVSISTLVLFAFLLETVVEVFKPLYAPISTRLNDVPLPYYISIVLGVAGAIVFKVNGLELFGVVGPPIVGQVVTGLICSRGSNFMHEIYKKIQSLVTGPTPIVVVENEEPTEV